MQEGPVVEEYGGWMVLGEWSMEEEYPQDGNIGIHGPFRHGNQLPNCKYLAMQPQLWGGGLGAV